MSVRHRHCQSILDTYVVDVIDGDPNCSKITVDNHFDVTVMR